MLVPLRHGPSERKRGSQQSPHRQRVTAFEQTNLVGTKTMTDKNLRNYAPDKDGTY
jgi:hypothetical protein